VDISKVLPSFSTQESTQNKVALQIGYLGIRYSSPDEQKGVSGIEITDQTVFETLNLKNLVSMEAGSGVYGAEKASSNIQSVIKSNESASVVTFDFSGSAIGGTVSRSHLIFESVSVDSPFASYGELLNMGDKSTVTSSSKSTSSNDVFTAYVIHVDSNSGSSGGYSAGDTRIMVYGNDGSIKNIMRFIYGDQQ
jgi:hypothetical protein